MLFVLWIIRNGINEGFGATRVELASDVFSVLGLMIQSIYEN